MHDVPTPDAHVDALLLIAGEYANYLLGYIEADCSHGCFKRWEKDSLRAVKTIQEQLRMIPELSTLRGRMALLQSAGLLADMVGEVFADQWSAGISQMLELAHDRLRQQQNEQQRKLLKEQKKSSKRKRAA